MWSGLSFVPSLLLFSSSLLNLYPASVPSSSLSAPSLSPVSPSSSHPSSTWGWLENPLTANYGNKGKNGQDYFFLSLNYTLKAHWATLNTSCAIKPSSLVSLVESSALSVPSSTSRRAAMYPAIWRKWPEHVNLLIYSENN